MTLQVTHARLERISRGVAIAGGYSILAIAFAVTIDVILRKFFHTTLGGATEIAGFLFAAGVALSYPYVLIDRANIRIDAAYNLLSTRTRAIADVLAAVSVLIFVGILTKSILGVWLEAIHTNATTIGVVNVPRWIVQTPWILGYGLFTLTALFLTIYSIIALMRGDWAQVNRIAGIPSLEETIEEETYDGGSHLNDRAEAPRNGEDK